MLKNLKLQSLMPIIVLAVLVVFFTFLNPNFFSMRNFARIAIAASPFLMVTIGVTFIIIMGSIDLSMEGTVSLTAIVFCFCFLFFGGALGSGGWVAIPLALLAGAIYGALNGFIHAKLLIPSFMSSLAMGFVGIGAAVLLTGGGIVRIDDDIFRSLLTYRIQGFPLMVYVAILFLIFGIIIQKFTVLGRNLYAIGGAEDLAAASGVPVLRTRILAFSLAGFYYSLAGVLQVAKLGQAESVTGANLMFLSITAAVVGGVALWGAIGGVFNALIGVLIVAVINNGMVVIGLPDYLQDGVLGILVIVAVILSTNRSNIRFVK
ncbi:MAG: ABC transporter permease [Euryarchaeota archaeon]|nr:ABC transporter permease [Euryarchaeota archaeon]